VSALPLVSQARLGLLAQQQIGRTDCRLALYMAFQR
jgi:hypothetical protein